MLASTGEALEAFAKSTHLGTLTFGPDNLCTLAVGETLDLEIEDRPDSGTLRLNAAVRVLSDADYSVLATLLTANFNGDGTGNAALSINPANDEIVLTQAVNPRHHDAATFTAEVHAFVRHALFWQSFAATLRPEADTSDALQSDAGIINLRL